MVNSISNILSIKDENSFCSLIYQRDETTLTKIVEIIQTEGRNSYFQGSNYYFMVSNLRKINSPIAEAIAPINVFMGSYDVEQSFGITYSGIRLALELRKLEAKVADTCQALDLFFSELSAGDSKALITDSGLVQGQKESYHAISLFAHVENQDIKIFINDPEGASDSYKGLAKKFPSGIKVHIYASSIKRQSRPDISCNAIAIEDCEVFQKNPYLINEMIQLNPLGKKNFTQMNKLPNSMHFSVSARELTMRVQALIFQSCLNRPG